MEVVDGGGMKNIITQDADYNMSANFTYADVVEQINAGVCPIIFIHETVNDTYHMCQFFTLMDDRLFFEGEQLNVCADGTIYYES